MKTAPEARRGRLRPILGPLGHHGMNCVFQIVVMTGGSGREGIPNAS